MGGDRLRGGVGPQRRRRLRAAGTRVPRPGTTTRPPAEPQAPPAHFETVEARSRTPLVMLVPIIVLVVVGLGVGLVPGLARSRRGRRRCASSTRQRLCRARSSTRAPLPPVPPPRRTGLVVRRAVAAGVVTAVVAVGVALALDRAAPPPARRDESKVVAPSADPSSAACALSTPATSATTSRGSLSAWPRSAGYWRLFIR